MREGQTGNNLLDKDMANCANNQSIKQPDTAFKRQCGGESINQSTAHPRSAPPSFRQKETNHQASKSDPARDFSPCWIRVPQIKKPYSLELVRKILEGGSDSR